MPKSVYLRPLRIEDAQISYRWRNNPKIWRFTGNRPNRYITPEIETEWLTNVLKRENELRFAICLVNDDKYIGNVFLTDISDTEAQVHIFIGDIENWGGGRAYEALEQLMDYAFEKLCLERLYSIVNRSNAGAMIAAKRLGWKCVNEEGSQLVTHIFSRRMYKQGIHHEYTVKRMPVLEYC